jgi:hypothetical protein
MAVAEVARALGLRADPGFRGVADLLDLLVAEECLARQGGQCQRCSCCCYCPSS